MNASFYDLLKYAATGQASPDMTYYDRMRASTLMGGAVQTLTGQPPLSFKADGTPLISWSMKGNGSQTGTPTPDNPIQPEFVGVRTAQLFEDKIVNCSIDSTGRLTGNASFDMYIAKVEQGVTYAASAPITGGFYTTKPTIGSVSYNGQRMAFAASPVTAPITGYMTFRVNSGSAEPMLNSGSAALPYEPFGWAEKITCAGQTVPVYLGQTQTVRRIKKLVLTGESDADNVFEYNSFIYVQKSGMLAETNAPFCNCLIGTNISSASMPANSVKQGRVSNQPFPAALVFKLDGITTTTGFLNFLSRMNSEGNPVTIWYVIETPETGISNEPLAKIGDYCDELNSEDAGVSIPTVKGQNTLTIDTDLQPSEMSITYRG